MIRVKVVDGINEFSTMGAIDDALKEALAWAKQNPERRTVLVFNDIRIPIEISHERQLKSHYLDRKRMFGEMKDLPWSER